MLDNQNAIEKLKYQYENFNSKFQEDIERAENIIVYHWPGLPGQEILLGVHQSFGLEEPFHIHDYFSFYYIYKGECEMFSRNHKTKITLREGDLYAGQPCTAQALCAHDDKDIIIIGLMIQKATFYRDFLQPLSSNSNFFHFLMDKVNDISSDKFMHLNLQNNKTVRDLLKIMVREFASPKATTNEILKSLVVSFLFEVGREYSIKYPQDVDSTMRIIMYMDAHLKDVTLISVAEEFSYHPNYLTALLKKEIGKPFSKILTDLRMNRAVTLIKNTNLPIKQIAEMVGYTNCSNFYKVFKNCHGVLPKDMRE